jgi:hypothetical protein
VLFRLGLRSELQTRIDAIRAAGYPVTCAELNEWYAIPGDAENAAYTIIDAFSYYHEPNETEYESLPIVGRAKLPARTEPLAEETKALVAQYIADNNETLELLHEAAAITHCRYPVDFSLGLGTRLGHLSDLKRSVKLSNLEAVSHAENEKPQLAAHSVISSFGLTRSLEKEPLLISQLVRIACKALIVSSLERAINRTEFTDEQLVELGRVMTGAEDSSAMARAFAGERCYILSVLREPRSLGPGLVGRGAADAPILELYRVSGLADMDADIFLDLMNDCMETTRLSLHQRPRAATTIWAQVEATSKIHILLHRLVPAFSRVVAFDVKITAYLRTGGVSLAVQRYRLAAGRLPDTLADLVPAYLEAVPKDPFDGDELRYKKLERGFVVYSIGGDLSDDGGKESLPRNKRNGRSSNWDITFTVER